MVDFDPMMDDQNLDEENPEAPVMGDDASDMGDDDDMDLGDDDTEEEGEEESF